jgi:adenylyltransferase/sulfurtransferase
MSADAIGEAARPLDGGEMRRYARHLVIPEVGLAGQERLKAGRVVVVGAGGLGSPVILYLAAAGVGTLGVLDHDAVDESNLQRQVLHATPDVGRPKVASAADRVRALNPHVAVEARETRLTAANALALLAPYDVVVDGSDNFATRYVVNDACVLLGRPLVHGAVHRFDGQASVFAVPGGPCYRCLHAEPPAPGTVANCAEAGVLGVLPGLVGLVQATEVLKLLLGVGDPLVGRILLVDGLGMRFHEVRVARDPRCPACGDHRTITAPSEIAPTCEAPAPAAGPAEITVEELARRRAAGDPPALLDVREPWEFQICNLGGQLVPLGELPGRVAELDPGREWAVLCHGGVRSARAVALLRQQGFQRAYSVVGGIEAWSVRIDPGVPRY